MMKKTLLLSLLVVFIGSASSVVSSEGCQDVQEKDRGETTLLRTDVEFAKASEAKGAAEAFSLFLAEDAIQLPADENPIFGREAIVKAMGSGYILKWEPRRAEVSNSGDLGWTWGTYELHVKDAQGKALVRFGKYINVWRKDKDGNWRVIADMGNTSPPPNAP
jgi:ketosteroid isomerase-like protein